MKLNIFKKNNLLYILCLVVFLILVVELCKFFRSKEGLNLTEYDKEKFFTRPWNKFCMFEPPSCRKYFLEKPGMIGVFPIGCHCQAIGEATVPPGLPSKCYEEEPEYLYK